MKRLAVVLLLLANCANEPPRPTATTPPTVATTSTTIDWLAKVRTANVQPDIEITEVTTGSDVMRIYTSLGYAPSDAIRRGMAAQVCFDARSAGWTGHIEVWAQKAGVLAWTGASNQGCRGKG